MRWTSGVPNARQRRDVHTCTHPAKRPAQRSNKWNEGAEARLLFNSGNLRESISVDGWCTMLLPDVIRNTGVHGGTLLLTTMKFRYTDRTSENTSLNLSIIYTSLQQESEKYNKYFRSLYLSIILMESNLIFLATHQPISFKWIDISYTVVAPKLTYHRGWYVDKYPMVCAKIGKALATVLWSVDEMRRMSPHCATLTCADMRQRRNVTKITREGRTFNINSYLPA